MTKRKPKRLLSLLLSLAMVFSLTVTPAFAADTDTSGEVMTESTADTDTEDETSSDVNVWDGSVATGFAGGNGTDADPYLIATGAQLAYLSEQVREGTDYDGCYFQLSADINLNDIEFMPIGGKNSNDTTLPFKGNFDGDGHTISNLKITVVKDEETLYFSAFNKQYDTHGDTKLGLFGYTYGDLENFTINNVSVDGTLLNGDLSNGGSGGATAAVLGNTKSSAQKMENIHVTGNVSIVGNKFVGGIMGYNGTGVTYSNCSVSGNVTITGNCYVGGIVGGGICNSAYNTTFTGCSVGSADSTVQISGYYCVGGISGAVESSGDSSSYTYLTNCSVIGDSDSYITCLKHDDSTADSGNSISNYFVGGLSGKFGWGSGNYEISGCTVEIDVNGSGAYHSGHESTSEINTDNLDVGAAFVGYTTCTGTITNTSYTGNVKVAYAFKQYSNDVITMTDVTINSSVASIGDTKYTSLADAFSAAEDGDTITLLQDVSVEESSKSDNGLYQVSGIGVTLDLNENTLTITNKRAFGVLTDGSSLTIKNGVINYNASGDTTLVITRNGASFNAEGVTFSAAAADEGTTTTSQYLVYAAAGGSVTLTDCTIDNVSNAVVKDNVNSATVVLNCCTYDVTAVDGSNTEDDAYTICFNNSSVLTEDSNGLVKVEDGYTYVVLEEGSVRAGSTIYVKEGGKLVLKGGSLSGSVVIRGGTLEVQSGTVSDDITVESGGTLTVSGGTVSGTLANSGTTSISGGTVSGAVTNTSSAELALSGGEIANTIKTAGTFTMTDGTVTATDLNSDNGAIHVSGGTVAISGGTVTASGDKARAISTASNASIENSTISGGTFTGSNLALLVQTGTTGLTVTGGMFITSASGMASIIDRADAISDGYAAYDTTYTAITKDSNNYYKSSVGDYIVIIADKDTAAAATVTAGDTTTYYTSLADAVSAANAATETTTITLLSDVSVDKGQVIFNNNSATITLELNGKTISRGESTYYALTVVYSGTTLTVQDSSTNKTGKIDATFTSSTSTTSYAIWNEGTLNIIGGTFAGRRAIYGTTGTVNISGGTISGAYIGVMASDSMDVNISGGTITGSSHSGAYMSSTGTLKITGGTISSKYSVNVLAGTLEIDGENVSIGGTYGVWCQGTSVVATIKSGKIAGETGGVMAFSGANVTIGTENSATGPEISGNYEAVEISTSATATSPAVVKIYSGTLSGTSYGICIYGKNSSTDCYSQLYVYGGTISATSYFGITGNGSTGQGYTTIYIYGGEITSTNGQAIYHPQQDGTLYVYGGTIKGDTGIEVRGGTVVIEDKTSDSSLAIEATGTSTTSDPNYSGSTTSGAAIVVAPYNLSNISVSIASGTFKGATAVAVVNPNSVESWSYTNSVKITGGTFTGAITENIEDVLQISGGMYSSQVEYEYCANDYQPSTAIIELPV